MATERKLQADGNGYLRRNKNRRPDSRDPHGIGNFHLNGVEYRLSTWLQDKGPGEPYSAFQVRPVGGDHAFALSRAAQAVVNGEGWTCPAGCAPGMPEPFANCVLCHGSGVFHPCVLLYAKALRTKRQCTAEDAADQLGIPPQRFHEMEGGKDLAPEAWGGPTRRAEVATALVRYLKAIGLTSCGHSASKAA